MNSVTKHEEKSKKQSKQHSSYWNHGSFHRTISTTPKLWIQANCIEKHLIPSWSIIHEIYRIVVTINMLTDNNNPLEFSTVVKDKIKPKYAISFSKGEKLPFPLGRPQYLREKIWWKWEELEPERNPRKQFCSFT